MYEGSCAVYGAMNNRVLISIWDSERYGVSEGREEKAKPGTPARTHSKKNYKKLCIPIIDSEEMCTVAPNSRRIRDEKKAQIQQS